MGYTLQALIALEEVICKAAPSNATVVRLPQGMAMIPFSERLREENGIPFLPLTDEGVTALPGEIVAFAADIAKSGKVAYVEATFFGGAGTQGCVTWDGTGTTSKPFVETSAINAALRFLGVTARDHHDEFDAVGLGKYRAIEDWEDP